MSVVAPNSVTNKPHKHLEDEFFFVLEGTAEFYLEGETTIGSMYSAFYCPSKLEHGIRNIDQFKSYLNETQLFLNNPVKMEIQQ